MNARRLFVRGFIVAVTLGFAAFSCVGDGSAEEPSGSQTAPAADKIELLFVQNSVAGTYDGKTLTLNGVGPTVFFSDRPQRISGHVHTAEFIRHWDRGSDNFAENPPNGTLSILGEKDVQSIVVELRSPDLKGNRLSYNVRVLQGQLPKSFTESSLFIDILGRWRMAATGMALGEARGMEMGAAMARPTYYYSPPTPAASESAPVYTAPPPPAAKMARAAPHTQATSCTQSQAAAVAKLKELNSLLHQGLISPSDYQADSQKLLDQLVR